MKRFLSTTAVLLTLTGPAFAEAHMGGVGTVTAEQSDFYASDLIGMRIYNAKSEMDNNSIVANGAETEWDDLGEINDIILSEDGQVRAVILGVGGFLGIGERDVSVSMDTIKVVREDGNDDRFLVVNTTKEALESAPEFDRNMGMDNTADASANSDSTMNTTASNDTGTAATAEATATEMANDAENATTEMANDAEQTADNMTDRPMLERPNVARDGYAEADMASVQDMTADDLEGSYVYGANDETVGEIDALIMGDNGKVAEVVINVGGFLGIGEKPVAVTWEELQVLKNAEGDDVRIYIDSTEEALEAQPEYQQ